MIPIKETIFCKRERVVMARSATQLHTHTQKRKGEYTTKHLRSPEINQVTQKWMLKTTLYKSSRRPNKDMRGGYG